MTIRATSRGALLLEMLVAVGLFVVAGLAIGASVNRGLGALIQDREQTKAADLARSAMAMLEAGIETPQTLNGPVLAWQDDSSMLNGDEMAGPVTQSFDEGAIDDSGWELEVLTEPSEFDGLTIVSVTAMRLDVDSGNIGISHTLHQLMRLREEGDDVVGEIDPLMEAAERGAQRNSSLRSTRGGS